LHGGGGPQTVAPIVGHLATTMHALAPTHPGWNGTGRPDGIASAADERYAGLVGAVIDIDGIGAVVDGEPLADFFSLDARQLAQAAWHDAERGYVDPAGFTPEQRAIQQFNGQTMAATAGRGMSDATLLGRLDSVSVPTLVVFGESDRIVTPAYGQAVARAIPGAEFAVIAAAGHLPHLEAPEATWATIEPFLNRSR